MKRLIDWCFGWGDLIEITLKSPPEREWVCEVISQQRTYYGYSTNSQPDSTIQPAVTVVIAFCPTFRFVLMIRNEKELTD
ncbi:UNVERIFIED_CONTAM: hypothetical protein RF648_20235 [Kocuria sp. CPCC 205274]